MPETSLPLPVRDLITVALMTCSTKTKVNERSQLLLNHDLKDVIVLKEGQALVVLHQGDHTRSVAKDEGKALIAGEVVREGAPRIPPVIPLTAAAQFTLDQGVRTLFLRHFAGGIIHPTPEISCRHNLKFLKAYDASELSHLGIKSGR